MHWQTYERLASLLLAEHRRRDVMFGARLEALMQRTDAMLARAGVER